jgi:hypothetical protein
MAYYAVLKLSIYYRYYFEVSIILGLHEGGFPLGEIFRPNRNFLFSYKHSEGTKQKSFEFEQ